MTGIREKGKARRKERIIQTAKRLLAEGGIEALSTRKLAEEAELSVHTLYALVGSKEQILAAVMEDNHNRVLADLLKIDEEDPIGRMFAIIDATHDILAEDAASQKPLMRVLMTLFYEGNLNPNPWWMMVQEKGWLENAVAEAMKAKLLKADFPAARIADLLMKIYLANLREYLFDKAGLDSFRRTTVFEFWYALAGAAGDDFRPLCLKNAKAAAKAIPVEG